MAPANIGLLALTVSFFPPSFLFLLPSSSIQAADLKHLLKQYELWANALFPKFTFRNFTDRVEAMGSKNAAFKVSKTVN